MKKILYIPFLVTATLILFALSIIPHHHHGGKPCFRAEHADHHATSDTNHDPLCFCSGNTYIYSTVEQRTKGLIYLWSSKETYFRGLFICPISFISINNNACGYNIPSISFKHREQHIHLYQSLCVSRLNGLRAPPYLS